MRNGAFHESDDDEANSGPKVELLTEFSSVPDTGSPSVKPSLVIERLADTFRGSRSRYVPELLRQQENASHGGSIEELEAEERGRNSAYGLLRNHPVSLGQDSVAPPAASRNDWRLHANVSSLPHEGSYVPRQYKRSVSPPSMSTLEEYEAIPVEAFGLAMLRGMGYDPSQQKKEDAAKGTNRRPDFLGLGASERPEESKSAEELAKKRYIKRKEERNYVPVLKVIVTGITLSKVRITDPHIWTALAGTTHVDHTLGTTTMPNIGCRHLAIGKDLMTDLPPDILNIGTAREALVGLVGDDSIWSTRVHLEHQVLYRNIYTKVNLPSD